MFRIGGMYQWIVLVLPLGLLIPVPLFLLHRRFPKLRLDYLVTPVLCSSMGWLQGGINASETIRFALSFFIHWFVRRRHPDWFVKYNYSMAAAISGGIQLMTFVSTFAIQGGGGGPALELPPYWGNNFQKGNIDYCLLNPGLGDPA